jgi:hypothetical protein
MTRLANLSLGVGTVLILSIGILLWTPSSVSAAPGEPQDGYGEQSSCSTLHKIAIGENLTTIAADYGVSVEALIEENGIEDANLIVENQALCIPGSHGDNGYGENGYGENGHDENGYGNQQNGYDENGYDKNGYGGPQNRYGDSENGHGENGYGENGYNENGYGRPDNGYGENGHDENGYGNQQNGYGNQEQYQVPGKAYDPNVSYEGNDNDNGSEEEEEEENGNGNGG